MNGLNCVTAYVNKILIITGFEPKLTKSGKPMPLPRYLRTRLLSEGRIPDQRFTQLMTHFMVFIIGDIVSVHDTGK